MLDVSDHSREKVVDTVNVVSLGKKPLTKMRSEKSGTAGDDHSRPSHLVFLLSFKPFMAVQEITTRSPDGKSLERSLETLVEIACSALAGYDARCGSVNRVLAL